MIEVITDPVVIAQTFEDMQRDEDELKLSKGANGIVSSDLDDFELPGQAYCGIDGPCESCQ